MKKEELLAALGRFLKENKIKQVDLQREMGIRQSIISDMLNGKRNADRLVQYLGEKYGFRPTHDVSMVVNQETRPYTTNSNGVRFYEQQDGKLMMQVPVVEYNALGSLGDDFTPLYKDRDEEELVFFYAEKVYHGKYIAFKVNGDSMDDGTRKSFQRGDIILVRELDKQDWMPKLHIADWPYWVVCWGNNIRLKEIVNQDERTITLHSLNPSPEYTDFQLNLENVHRLFNVIEIQPKPWRAKSI